MRKTRVAVERATCDGSLPSVLQLSSSRRRESTILGALVVKCVLKLMRLFPEKI